MYLMFTLFLLYFKNPRVKFLYTFFFVFAHNRLLRVFNIHFTPVVYFPYCLFSQQSFCTPSNVCKHFPPFRHHLYFAPIPSFPDYVLL